MWNKYEAMSNSQKMAALNQLLAEWREPGLIRVLPSLVIPDTTNREYTGISATHLHYIATSMQRGFTPRDNITGKGHDLPVFIRETTGSDSLMGSQSLAKWRNAQRQDSDYPPQQPWMDIKGQDFFCSLGNGHFFQALNLFGTNSPCKFSPGATYSAGNDIKMTEALTLGVYGLGLRTGLYSL
jgi:hypothetical protein